MEQKVIELVSEYLSVPVEDIQPSMELKHDLNATDLELADLFQTLEKTFTLTISREETEKFQTVSDIINFITDHADEIV